MRSIQYKLLLFISAILILSACSADGKGVSSLCEHLKNMSDRKYSAHITAIFPKREVSFSVDYNYSKDSDDRVVVTAPEEISGIAFSVSEKSSTLEFDGMRLAFGSPGSSEASPLSAISDLISVWRDGNYDEALESDMFGEDSYLMIYKTDSGKGENEYRTWFSKNDFSPLYAEIYSDGIRIIECKFERTY